MIENNEIKKTILDKMGREGLFEVTFEYFKGIFSLLQKLLRSFQFKQRKNDVFKGRGNLFEGHRGTKK